MIAPPRLAARILARALRDDPAGPAILGDLHEDFVERVVSRGPAAARLWYRREALALAAGRIVHRTGRGARSASGLRPGTLAEDARHAFRTLRRSPGFALFIGGVIGLGVAAVTTVYSVLEPLAVSLPFEDSGELVWISNTAAAGDSSLSAVSSRTVNLIDFRDRAESFRGIAGYDVFFSARAYTWEGVDEPERVVAVAVTPDFLPVLGVLPALGRGFTAEEGSRGGPAAAILSHRFWRDGFGADPGVIGRPIRLNGEPRTVVGVLPPGFDFSSVFSPGTRVDVLLPFVVARDNGFQGNTLAMIGRLKPDVSPAAARTELRTLIATLQEEEAGRWGLGAEVETLRAHLAGPFRDSLVLLAVAAATLLLIVCVNVSGVMLARAPTRAREMAVRTALGATRGRLMRQLVIETLGVSLVGAAIGGGLAWLATAFVRRAASVRIPRMDAVELDLSTLAVAAGVSVLTGVVVGLIPAVHAAARETGAMRATARRRSASRGARRLREALVVSEVALACALLVVGGLLLTSLRAVLDVDLGFEAENSVAWTLLPTGPFETPAEKSAFYARLVERVASTPGAENVGLIDALPLGRNRSWPIQVVGAPDDARGEAFPHVVDPGYVPAMRIPLVAGRNLSRDDRDETARVVLVNETAARTLFGDPAAAIGRQVQTWGPWEWEVVGVVRDVRHLSPETGSGIEVYFPMTQMADYWTMDLVIRSRLPAGQLVPSIRGALAEVDPGMPTGEFRPVEAAVAGAVSDRRFALGILAAFGAAAVLLAGLGIYGVLSQTVAERRPEIGIRMALGAAAPDILRGVLGRMLILTTGGVAAGWGLALLVSRSLGSVLFGVGPVDPAAFGGTALVLLGVGLIAAGLPARRAVSTDVRQVLEAG